MRTVGKGGRGPRLRRTPVPGRLGEAAGEARHGGVGERLVVRPAQTAAPGNEGEQARAEGMKPEDGAHPRRVLAPESPAAGLLPGGRPVVARLEGAGAYERAAARPATSEAPSASESVARSGVEPGVAGRGKGAGGSSRGEQRETRRERRSSPVVDDHLGGRRVVGSEWTVAETRPGGRQERRDGAARDAVERRGRWRSEPAAKGMPPRDGRREWRRARARAEAMLAAAEESLRLEMARW